MELKNVNSNGNIIDPSNLNKVNISLGENYKIWNKNKIKPFAIFSTECHDYLQNKISHNFNLIINFDWIKTFLVDMDLFHNKIKS